MPFRPDPLDGVALPWLVTVRWAGVLAQVAAVVAGAQGLTGTTHLPIPVLLIGAAAASNVWLSWRLGRRRAVTMAAGGWLVCADVSILSWLLHGAGGVLNPVSIFYLVYIVLAALVLDRIWAWVVTALSIGGYGLLFAAPSEEVARAGSMHPEIGLHVRGMWLAFAATSLIVAILVARLATLIERRDRALADLRDRAARDARLAAMSTLAAGAAHELSTPLATIAVAARELELALDKAPVDDEAREDARLIRAEVERCRRLLHDMSGRFSQPLGEGATRQSLDAVLDATLAELSPAERQRVRRGATRGPSPVTWPTGVVARALVNIIRNALQASPAGVPVEVATAVAKHGHVTIRVVDAGTGMTPEVLARAGEPFYTTKAQGDGTGLGLFVARSTVEQLGGTLTVTSREGAGTTVTLSLPCNLSTPGTP
ncbi:MAG: HAMP domain-containing histidine kinase [Acidobacteria bacterium]|nr:HAMP domain-containing histidine kinase [Acidobacteriota bacterium]